LGFRARLSKTVLRDLDRACSRYRTAVTTGRVPAGRRCTQEEQVERWRHATERAVRLSRMVCFLLHDLGVAPARYCEYLGFALRLDRFQRHHKRETLRLIARELTFLWSARLLDRTVLEAVCDLVLSSGDSAAGSWST